MAAKIANLVRLLLVSREPSITDRLQDVARRNDWEIEVASGGMEALERVQSGSAIQLILLDLVPGDSEGLHTLRWLQRVRPDVPVIMLSPPENTGQVLDGVRLGAQDYLLKPCNEEQMDKVIRRHLNGSDALPSTELSTEQIEVIGDDLFFVAVGAAMQKVRARAELLSQVNAPVLITGEPGTGKEVTARLIHKLSVRSGFRLIQLNCSALSGDFLENELFGYGRAASQDKLGKLELAHRGTIVLEEIAEMPTSLQSKLLRVLQDKQFLRASDESVVDIDVRVIATTSTSIERSLADKKLREDLYYRLSAFTIQVPPLRQRKEEIPLLMGHLMSRMAKHYSLPPRMVSAATLEKCQRYGWPGNLAELENFVKRYLVTGDDAAVTLDAEQGMFEEKVDLPNDGELAIPGSLKSLVRSAKGDTERNAIATALEKTHWNRKAASRMLRISYRALLYKIQEYHISPPGAYLSPASLGQGAKGHGE